MQIKKDKFQKEKNNIKCLNLKDKNKIKCEIKKHLIKKHYYRV